MNIGKKKSDSSYIEISEEARKTNLAVFGIKNTGKAYTMIPALFFQDLKNKNTGITIFVDTPELSRYLYAMCVCEDRKADILKPSINIDILEKLFCMTEWNYDEIEKIYDFKKAIKAKKITIIDMEAEKFGEKAVRASSMLLLQLQAAMVNIPGRKPDYAVYIDGASDYIGIIKNLLKYGDFYGFKNTLFFKSRSGIKKEYIDLVDDYIRNYVLLQGVSWEDAKYFGERFGVFEPQTLMNRDYGTVTCEILEDGTFKRTIVEGTIIELPESKKTAYETELVKVKRNLKTREIDIEDQHHQLDGESKKLKSDDDEKSYMEEIEDRIGIENDEEIVIEESPETEEPEVVTEKTVQEEKNTSAKANSSSLKPVYHQPQTKTGKEPQLNQRIKTASVEKKEDRTDYSILEEFDGPSMENDIPEEIEIPENEFENDPEIEIPEEFEEEFEGPEIEELPDFEHEEKAAGNVQTDPQRKDVKIPVGNKNRPLSRFSNNAIKNSLNDFRIDR